jgi:hypothetical protein
LWKSKQTSLKKTDLRRFDVPPDNKELFMATRSRCQVFISATGNFSNSGARENGGTYDRRPDRDRCFYPPHRLCWTVNFLVSPRNSAIMDTCGYWSDPAGRGSPRVPMTWCFVTPGPVVRRRETSSTPMTDLTINGDRLYRSNSPNIPFVFHSVFNLFLSFSGGFMPRRNDIHKVLIIGSGPIIIGQACEFDYSGTQACKALKKEGYEIVLVNSNPATIMTDRHGGQDVYRTLDCRKFRENYRPGKA